MAGARFTDGEARKLHLAGWSVVEHGALRGLNGAILWITPGGGWSVRAPGRPTERGVEARWEDAYREAHAAASGPGTRRPWDWGRRHPTLRGLRRHGPGGWP